MCRSGPWRSGKGIGSFETGGTDGYYLPCWDWELKPDLLLEGHMLLMVELLVYESFLTCTPAPFVCLVLMEIRRGHKIPGTGVTDCCEQTCGCWEPN